MKTRSKIKQAARLLHAGGLVAFPTETVYGLGADARNPEAIQKVFLVKERPFHHPLIVHLAYVQQLQEWAEIPSLQVMQLAQSFWPGPLTLILPKKAHVADILTGGQETIALRIPKHPVAYELIQLFGSGIVGPSANKFTHVSPTSARAVEEELGKEIDMILDGGECAVGLESTIVDMSGDEPKIVRPGMIHRVEIENVLGKLIPVFANPKMNVPGKHFLHYAPKTKTVLVNSMQMQAVLNHLSAADLPTVILIHSDFSLVVNGIDVVKMPRTATDFAHALYQTLRALDKKNYKTIFVEDVPEGDEWDAIRDRLFKATGSGQNNFSISALEGKLTA